MALRVIGKIFWVFRVDITRKLQGRVLAVCRVRPGKGSTLRGISVSFGFGDGVFLVGLLQDGEGQLLLALVRGEALAVEAVLHTG